MRRALHTCSAQVQPVQVLTRSKCSLPFLPPRHTPPATLGKHLDMPRTIDGESIRTARAPCPRPPHERVHALHTQCTHRVRDLNNFSSKWSTFEALVNAVPWWRLLGAELWQGVSTRGASSHAASAATG